MTTKKTASSTWTEASLRERSSNGDFQTPIREGAPVELVMPLLREALSRRPRSAHFTPQELDDVTEAHYYYLASGE